MLVVHVSVKVKSEFIDAFVQATRRNAAASLLEPGVARFDIIQAQVDPSHFLLVEVYRDEDAPARHKETAHYQTWRDAVAEMMAEPRQSQKFSALFPEPLRWSTPPDDLPFADTLPGRAKAEP